MNYRLIWRQNCFVLSRYANWITLKTFVVLWCGRVSSLSLTLAVFLWFAFLVSTFTSLVLYFRSLCSSKCDLSVGASLRVLCFVFCTYFVYSCIFRSFIGVVFTFRCLSQFAGHSIDVTPLFDFIGQRSIEAWRLYFCLPVNSWFHCSKNRSCPTH